MAIETICKGCARKLRVGDEFAGRKARCPHCKTIYTVPASDAALDASPDPAESTGGNWLLRAKDGTVYGPVSKSELDSWIRDGRSDAESQVREEREVIWHRAAELYPSLLSMAASNANPFASDPAVPAQTDNPYVSPRAAGGPVLGLRPHRGGLVLTLGLLGFFCCQFFAIAAWIMGYADLKEIDAGRMDPTGRGLTQAGMIIGIIGTVLMILYCGFQMLMIPLAIMNGQ